MQKTEIIKLLKTFSKKELTAFKKFVTTRESSNANLSSDLLEYIYAYRKNFDNKQLTKAKAKAFLDKKRQLSDSRFRQYISDLSQYAQDFLVINELKKQPIQYDYFLGKVLNERGLSKKFEKILSQKTREEENKKASSVEDFHKKYLLISDNYELATQKNNIQTAISLGKVAKAFDKYAIAQQLQYACVLLNNTKRLPAEKDNEQAYKAYSLSLIQQIEKEYIEKEIIIKLYYQLLLVLTDSAGENIWNELLSILKDNTATAHLNKDEIQNISNFIFNFCNSKLKSGDTSYLTRYFELYKIRIEKSELFQQGKLPTTHYKNIVRLACRANEFEKAADFIETYKDKVAEKYRKNYYHLNLAALFYYQNDYDKTLQNLALVGDLERQDHLNVEMLYLKTYYAFLINGDENYDERLRYKINAFESYLRRNKEAIGKDWQFYKNFLALFKKLFKLYSERNIMQNEEFEARKAILVQEIENCQKLVDKNWLENQLNNL